MSLASHVSAALERHLAEHGALVARDREALRRTSAIVDRICPALAMPSFSSRYPELTSPAAAWERFCNNASRRKALYRAIKPRIEAKVRARNASATYSERSFFDGDACQHCADRDEHLRLNRLRQSVDRTRRSSFAFAGQRVGQGRAA